MRKLLLATILLSAAACGKKEEAAAPAPADNAVTRHAGELRQDVQKAGAAQSSANANTAELQKAVDEANAQ